MSFLTDLEDLADLVREASAPVATDTESKVDPATETIVSEQFELSGFMARSGESSTT